MRPMRADRLFDTEDKVFFFLQSVAFQGEISRNKRLGVGWAPRARVRQREEEGGHATRLLVPPFRWLNQNSRHRALSNTLDWIDQEFRIRMLICEVIHRTDEGASILILA